MKDAQPKTLLEAVVYFSDPDRAFEFAKSIRWANGIPICPHCGCSEHSFLRTRRIFKCKACKRQFSIKVGSIFEDSPIGFDKWLPCIWLIANSKNSISSHEAARSLGVTQKTAWFMLHRIREAMSLGSFNKLDRPKLSGTIEVDEVFVGGIGEYMHRATRERRIHARGAHGKTAVQGMLERGGEVRAEVVPQLSLHQTQVALRINVEEGSAIYSDEASIYNGIERHYAHKTVTHSKGEYVSGDVTTNGIENFWSLLKRSIKGSQIHVAPEHLQRYVDERAFAFNYREESDLERMRQAVSGVGGKRLTWAQLTAK